MQIALYKSTRPGLAGVYNVGVRVWTQSEYSHVELVFKDGMSASASYMDKGVRFKTIEFNPDHWDFIDVPAHLEDNARAWFEAHKGAKYDVWGNVHFVFGPVRAQRDKWFCSEAIAAALGYTDPWRYDPGVLASTLARLNEVYIGVTNEDETQQPTSPTTEVVDETTRVDTA